MARTGRPSSYDPKYVGQAFRLALLGLTNQQIAKAFGCSTATLHKWGKDHPEFLSALNNGKDVADAQVAVSLYQRATGFEHPEEHIHVRRDGTVIRVPTTKKYPPDTTAAIFWLKNRQRKLWRDGEQANFTDPAEQARELRKHLDAMDRADGVAELAAALDAPQAAPSDE